MADSPYLKYPVGTKVRHLAHNQIGVVIPAEEAKKLRAHLKLDVEPNTGISTDPGFVDGVDVDNVEAFFSLMCASCDSPCASDDYLCSNCRLRSP